MSGELEAKNHADAVLNAYKLNYLPLNKKGLTIDGIGLMLPDPDMPLGVILKKDSSFIVLLGEQHSTETLSPLLPGDQTLMIAGAKAVVAAIGKLGAKHTTIAAVELPIKNGSIVGSGAGLTKMEKLTISGSSDKNLGSINHSLFYYRATLLKDVMFAEGENTVEVVEQGLAAKSDERNPGIAAHLINAAASAKGPSVTVLPVGLSHLGGNSIQKQLTMKGWSITTKIV
ncbi:hypothetical protein HCH_02976 [Hahella chejuensis KCTC 2396]|uniref:Uncharacterized protein n=1 Tax=Hahella chejuensis (strain KCTC 2396) TaxID=349521 RepID=Q2SHX9_HAHCH|nr:hypothetical protein [Hahella chejuensis]ABC29745.1 hypothetical protein HCH_02976 [Hahella chejuensis KCTC 2396]